MSKWPLNSFKTWLVAFVFLSVVLYFSFKYQKALPEYQEFQKAYIGLEDFRATITKESPPAFKEEVKEVVIDASDIHSDSTERCICCHVGVKLPYFSPTKISYNINGEMDLDNLGTPLLEANPSYVFSLLDKRIDKLKEGGDAKELKKLEALRTVEVNGKSVSLKKVLNMHPLMGRETKPFELHPIEEYGCVVCHSGDGSCLDVRGAHGAIFDGDYEVASGNELLPAFVERDLENDPVFARVFNFKPERNLVMPLLVGPLMQSRCVDCHQSSEANLNHMFDVIDCVTKKKNEQIDIIEGSLQTQRLALLSLLNLIQNLEDHGCSETVDILRRETLNTDNTPQEIDHYTEQLKYIQAFHENLIGRKMEESEQPKFMINRLTLEIEETLGQTGLADELIKKARGEKDKAAIVDQFLIDHKQSALKQTYFAKLKIQEGMKEAVKDFDRPMQTLAFLASQKKIVKEMAFSIEPLLYNYKQGKELYITQSCYACHRISGFSRGSTAPDLTKIGLEEPWYIKHSIMWPQGKLKTSTMPTFGFDVVQAQDLMTFMLSQNGHSQLISPMEQKACLKDWENGEKLPWEMPVSPTEMTDLNFAMTTFATQGCASCHKIQGYKSNVAFVNDSYKEQDWFTDLFPEQLTGARLVETIEKHQKEINEKIFESDKKDTILQEIEKTHPGVIESFYANFAFAKRAKDKSLKKEGLKAWKDCLHRVLCMHIELYGLGRDIGPHLNWSGVYRNTEWLMGHFNTPGNFIPRSIMPAFPFDETKFYSLTLMLQKLGRENRDSARKRWEVEGFNPKEAYELFCAQCHGNGKNGNGPVAQMLYPPPKNLKNTTFLLNLTKERAIASITHGVKGTPMPPWGEAVQAEEKPVLTTSEIRQLVDWLFQSLPDSSLIATTSKWDYTPLEAVQEMKKEGIFLQTLPGNAPSVKYDENIADNDLVHNYFSEEFAPQNGPDKKWYFIKKEFYTPHNIEEGKLYFLNNCAACHGAEATGQGQRAPLMIDAKPRMLTNLPWLESKDDLRLLCSIKFGVAGTAMTPWGDQTTSSQRMQMVMFIRTLSAEKILREKLSDLSFDVFTHSVLMVQEGRVKEYTLLDEAQKNYIKSFEEVLEQNFTPEEGGKEYTEELQDKKSLQELKDSDQILINLTHEIQEERSCYEAFATNLINKKIDHSLVDAFFEVIKTHGPLFIKQEGAIVCIDDEEKEKGIQDQVNAFVTKTETLIKKNEDEITRLKALTSSESVKETLSLLQGQQTNLMNVKTKMMSDAAIAKRSRKKQCTLWKQFQDNFKVSHE